MRNDILLVSAIILDFTIFWIIRLIRSTSLFEETSVFVKNVIIDKYCCMLKIGGYQFSWTCRNVRFKYPIDTYDVLMNFSNEKHRRPVLLNT